jgi:hypothetical protein
MTFIAASSAINRTLTNRFGASLETTILDEPLDKAYNPDEPRDANGEWSSDGGATHEHIRGYAAEGTDINTAMRRGREDQLNDDQKRIKDKMTSLLGSDQTKLPSDMTVHRGFTVPQSTVDRIAQKVADGKPAYLTDKAFVSTTKSEDVAEEFRHDNAHTGKGADVIMHITVPAGQHALDMNSTGAYRSSYSTERELSRLHEVLLPPGTRFRVDGIRKSSDHYIVHAHVAE